MANPYLPHVIVLPEDEANRAIAVGFRLDSEVNFNRIRIERNAGGWLKVLRRFEDDYVPTMERFPARILVMLIDFDNHPERRAEAESHIPPHLKDRVFVLGTLSEPERLRAELGEKLEPIGQRLAEDCRTGANETWGHRLLLHNAPELERFRTASGNLLFED